MSNTRKDEKKNEELGWLKRFLKSHTDTDYEILDVKYDPPDCVLKSEDSIISVEITGVISPRKKERESLEEKIVLQAKKIFELLY